MRRFLIFTSCVMILAGFGCGDDELDPRTNPFDPQNPDTGGDPFGLTVTPEPQDPRTFVLKWNEPPEVDFDVYLIYRQKGNGLQIRLARIPKEGPNSLQHKDTPQEDGHTYTYRIRLAREVEGQPREESPLSKITGNTTQYLNALPMVTTIHPPVIEGNTAKITWEGKDDDGEVKSYRYELSGTDQKGSGAEPHHDFAKLREGEYTIRVWAIDNVGHEGPPEELPFNLTVKWGSNVQINGGEKETTNQEIKLTVSAKHGTEVLVSNSEDFTKSTQFDVNSEIEWDLARKYGTQTVYVQLRDEVGNVSAPISASIRFLPEFIDGQTEDNDGQRVVKDGVKMVLIPAGTFEMGDHFNADEPDERPVHTVFTDSFYMDEHEVTIEQYEQFIGELPDKVTISVPEAHPVFGVSWEEATEYAKRAGKRLPTEAEWEKAARGGLEGKRYPWGDEKPGYEHANYDYPMGHGKTTQVKRFTENHPYGLYDMAGNIWEWCTDWYDESYYKKSPRENPMAASGGNFRVLRGGSWQSEEKDLRVANRGFKIPNVQEKDIGFRCVISASEVFP